MTPACKILLIISIATVSSSASSQEPIPPAEMDAIVSHSGMGSEDAAVLSASRIALPTIEQSVLAAKVLNKATGEVSPVYLNEMMLPVDLRELEREELAAYNAIHGKRHHLLTAQLQRAVPDARIPVAIWLDSPDTSPAEARVKAQGHLLAGGKPLGGDVQAAHDALVAEKSRIHSDHNQGMADAVQALGGQIDYKSVHAPLIFATLTPAQIAQVEGLAGIQRIYAVPELTEKLDTANPAVQNADMKAAGHTGNAGIKVGIVESGRIEFANRYLNHLAGAAFRPLGSLSEHTTNVAGCVASKRQAGNGTADTAAAGDDVQVIAVGAAALPNAVIIREPAAGGNGIADTAATGDDVQVIAVGAAAAPNAVIIREPPTDPAYPAHTADGMAPNINMLSANYQFSPNAGIIEPFARGNGTADSMAAGDDVQMIAVGAAAAAGAVVVAPGPNQVLNSGLGGDDIAHNIMAGNLANIVAAAEWAITNGAKILNMSIGEAYSDLTFDVSDKYVDHVVFTDFVAVCIAASNECGAGTIDDGGDGIVDTALAGDDVYTPAAAGGVGSVVPAGAVLIQPGPNGFLDSVRVADDVYSQYGAEECKVTSPGLAYNAITVGAIDDQETAALPDDIRADYSCYVDLAGDYEKPELSAPGSQIFTTSCDRPAVNCEPGVVIDANSDHIQDNNQPTQGTSFATPIVSGLLANMIHMDATLSAWPEATKALAICCAKRNVYDHAIERYGDRVNWDPKEGAGTIIIDEAHDIITKGHYDKDVVGAADFPIERLVSVRAGERFRYAIAWSTHTSGGTHENITNDVLTADLDIYVYDPANNLVSWSNSFNNAYEVAAFDSPVAQNYRVRIEAFRFDAAFEYLGQAWNADDPLVPKFSQPPTPCEEDLASNLDWTDLFPNVVIADDFISDGRLINAVRWWGSRLDTSPVDSKICDTPGTCAAGFTNCAGDPAFPCYCGNRPDGSGACFDGDIFCPGFGVCFGGDADCPAGTKCILDTCCPEGPVCLQNCCDSPSDGGERLAAPAVSDQTASGVAWSGQTPVAAASSPPIKSSPGCRVGTSAAGSHSAERSGNVFAGIDLWTTPPGSQAREFSSAAGGTPIPAGFFGPGSDPFDGVINLQGEPFAYSGSGPCLEDADTVVQRLTDAILPVCPSQDTVPIQIVALNLVSTPPVTVNFSGPPFIQTYDVRVCLSDLPPPTGSMTIFHECEDGGTYNATLPVQAKFIFTNTSNPSDVVIFDTGVEGLPPRLLNAFNGWVHTPNPLFDVTAAGPGAVVDGNCDGVPETLSAGTSNFVPGIFTSPCDCLTPPDPTGANQFKELSPELDQLAEHGVLPAQHPRDSNGNGIPDACEGGGSGGIADGWLISFHEPLVPFDPAPRPPLGLYFCDSAVVQARSTNILPCDGHPVIEYFVQLEDCCLLHAYPDSRLGTIPAQPDGFHEQKCFAYDLDIQAVVGVTYIRDPGGFCVEVPTGNTADADFWGWHTTSIEHGVRSALQSAVTVGAGGQWYYGPWSFVTPTCGSPNMAFELLTTNVNAGPDCNDNGIPDQCEDQADCNENGIPDQCDIAGGTSADANDNGIPDECEPPTCPSLVTAASRKACDIPIDLTPGAPITTEPRQGGITQLVFSYTGPPPLIPPTIDSDCTCPPPPIYAPYGGSLPSCTVAGFDLICTFSPALPCPCTYRFNVCNGQTTSPVELRCLLGDVNDDGQANATDRSIVVGVWTGSGYSCKTDLNNNGVTNATDRSIVVGSWTSGMNCAP